MSTEAVFLLAIALCAATACLDPRVRGGSPARVLGAAVAARAVGWPRRRHAPAA